MHQKSYHYLNSLCVLGALCGNLFPFPRPPFTFVERPLQIHFFLTNKPNFKKPKMNLSDYMTSNYKEKRTDPPRKNKPNQTQFQTY